MDASDTSLAHLNDSQKQLLARATAMRKYGFASAAASVALPFIVIMLVKIFAPHTIIDTPYTNTSPLPNAVQVVCFYYTPVALIISAIGHVIVRHLMNRDDPNAWGPIGTAFRSVAFASLVLIGSIISVFLHVFISFML